MLKRSHSPSPATLTSPGVPTSQRDACAAGAPPPGTPCPGEAGPANQHLPSQLEPDASRNNLRLDRLLLAVDVLATSGLGHLCVTYGPQGLERNSFDALPGDAAWFNADPARGTRQFWAKSLATPGGQRVAFYTHEPPIDDAA